VTTENERSFEESVNSLSDSARGDYEHRKAKVIAISDKVKPLWVRIEQIYERKKYLETSKWMPIVYILVVLGAAVNIFYGGTDGELKIGTVMMLLGVVGYVAYQYDFRSEGKRAEILHGEEEDYLQKWLSCGGSKSNFENLRALYWEEFALEQLISQSEAEMMEKRAALNLRLNQLWDDISWGSYRDVSGSIPPG
jgi:hypothetical protein